MKYFKRCLFMVTGTVCLAAGCHSPKKQGSSPTDQALSVGNSSAISSCPFLTRDASGSLVLSWIQQAGEQDLAKMYYAVYSDRSHHFEKAQPIPTTSGVEPHGENMPKLVFQKNGSMMAVFGVKNPHPGNAYTGAVFYTQSFDAGRHWTPASPLVKDSVASFDQRYFDVALLPNGEIGVVWLNNSEPQGSTLYFASTRGNRGFSTGKVIGRHTCQCCRTDLMVDDSGIIHVVWRDILMDSIRDMVYTFSKDTGATFSHPVRISPDNWVVNGCPHTGPSMALNREGLHFVWYTMGGGAGIYYCHTDDNGLTFSPRQTVSEVASARHPQIVALPDNDLAIVWDEGKSQGDVTHQHVGLQMRGPDGLLLDSRYLTADSLDASFPQIAVVGNHTALVAYTQGSGKEQTVKYRTIRLQP